MTLQLNAVNAVPEPWGMGPFGSAIYLPFARLGPDNDRSIEESCEWADQIICAWGTHGAHLKRGAAVTEIVRKSGASPYHLGLSKEGHPKHPLYIAYAQQPMRWW